jgi:uncharacterized protein GlcG (DUF336 family)
MPRSTITLSLSDADAAVSAARAAASASEHAVSVAVVNEAGHLLAFARMDGASTASVDTAVDKAYTSAVLGFTTVGLFEVIKDDPSLLAGISVRPRIVVFGGGVPVLVDGRLLGGIGVSGAPTAGLDQELAATALQAVVR